MTLCLGGIIILLLLPTMAWGLGRQAASTDWDAPAEERAEAARGSCVGILLTAALLAALFAVTLAGAGAGLAR